MTSFEFHVEIEKFGHKRLVMSFKPAFMLPTWEVGGDGVGKKSLMDGGNMPGENRNSPATVGRHRK